MKNSIKLLVATIIMFPSISRAQSINFSLNGKVGKLSSPYKAYLAFAHPDGSFVDSTIIDHGNFTFKGTAKGAEIAYVGIGTTFGSSKAQTFYLEQGPITVVGMDSIENAVITGGKLNADYKVLQKALEPFKLRKKAVWEAWRVTPDEKKATEEFKAYVVKQRDTLDKEEKSIDKNFIVNNPSSLLSFLILKDMGGYTPDVAEVEPLFNSLSAEIRLSAEGMKYSTMLKKMKTTAVGVRAPDFTEADTSGKPVSLHDFKGRYVLVDFWASWCYGCRMENPNIIKAFNKYKNDGFTVLGVSLDDRKSKDKWIKAINDDHVYWTQVSALKGFDGMAAKLYTVQVIPQNFLIDPNGIIIAKNLRGDELTIKLLEIFGKK